MDILKDLLGEWGDGRLGPGRFARLWLTCFGMLLGVPLVAISAVAAINLMLTGKLPEPTAFIGALIVFPWILLCAAMFNVSLKRGRDIGFSGTLTGLAIILLFLFGGVPFFLTILLAFAPSQSFGRTAA